MQPTKYRSSRLLVPLTATIFCLTSGGQLHAQAGAVKDSAGIHIIQNPARASASTAFTFATKPIFDVGGLEKDPLLEFDTTNGYMRAAVLSDGGIAVIDKVRIQLFDAKGQRTRVVGRDGAGPQEFRQLTAICRTRGDTLVVNDGGNHRIAILDRTGKFVRTVVLPRVSHLSGCLEDGSVVLAENTFSGDATSSMNTFTRARLDGTPVNQMGTLYSGMTGMGLRYSSLELVTPRGLAYVDARGSDIDLFTAAGKLETVLRTADPIQKISGAELDQKLDMRIPRNVQGAARQARMDEMKAAPSVNTFPAYVQLMADPAGRIWANTFDKTQAGPIEWIAFGPDGKLLGKMVFPRGSDGQIVGFGRESVLVQARDSDGAAHFRLHQLVKTP